MSASNERLIHARYASSPQHSAESLESGKTQALSAKAGDKVLIGKYSGSEVKLDGKDHIILREDDILAILEK